MCRLFFEHCNLTINARRLYDGPCPKQLRGNKVLSIIPSDYFSRLLQPLDFSSHTDWAERIHIFDIILITAYIFVINCYDLSVWEGCWFMVYVEVYLYVVKCLSYSVLIAQPLREVGSWVLKSWVTKPVGWLLSFQLTVLRRSVIAV